MTDPHPLTDEMCREISPFWRHLAHHDGGGEFIKKDMRAAYDLAIEKVEESVKCKHKVWRQSGYIAGADAVEEFFEEVMQAMRPQEDNS